jgi:cyclic beta-1,2-glucan synthetase
VFLRNLRHDAATALAQVLLGVTFLAFHAFDTRTPSPSRSCGWSRAAAARVGNGGDVGGENRGLVGRRALLQFAAEMAASPIIAGVVAAVVLVRTRARCRAAPFLLLWVAAPAVAYWLSVPVGARVRPLGEAERRCCAGRRAGRGGTSRPSRREADAGSRPTTTRSATTLPTLARRTSPTNIGMGLLSALAAHDLGLPHDRRARRTSTGR